MSRSFTEPTQVLLGFNMDILMLVAVDLNKHVLGQMDQKASGIVVIPL